MFPSESDLIHEVLGNSPELTVVNLGAHFGQEHEFFAGLVRGGGYLRHIMVEPDPANCAQIDQNTRVIYGSKTCAVSLFKAAIWSENCTRSFRSADDGSGSLREPTGDRFTRLRFSGPFDVKCITLDSVSEACNLSRIDLLWVDIQGSEREMILGGTKSLAMSRYLFMEVETTELYRGEALKDELLEMLPRWQVLKEFEYNVFLRNTAIG